MTLEVGIVVRETVICYQTTTAVTPLTTSLERSTNASAQIVGSPVNKDLTGVLAVVVSDQRPDLFIVLAQGVEPGQIQESSRPLTEVELRILLKDQFRESELLIHKRIELARMADAERYWRQQQDSR